VLTSPGTGHTHPSAAADN